MCQTRLQTPLATAAEAEAAAVAAAVEDQQDQKIGCHTQNALKWPSAADALSHANPWPPDNRQQRGGP